MRIQQSLWFLGTLCILAGCGNTQPKAVTKESAARPIRGAPLPSEAELMSKPMFADTVSFLDACRSRLRDAEETLKQLLAVSGVRNEENTLQVYNRIAVLLGAVASESSLMSSVHPDAVVRDAADICEQEAQKFATDMSLNRDLYEAFLGLDVSRLEADAKRLVEKSLRDFKRSGVDKDEDTRAKVKRLEEELVEIGQDFDRNIRDDVRFIELDSAADMAGLPQDYIESHKADAVTGKIRITTDYPDSIPFMMYADNLSLREKLWKENMKRGYPKNEAVLKSMLQKREALAKLLGYASFAEYSLETRMIKTADKAESFIEQITDLATQAADRDYAVLLAKKQESNSAATQVFAFERGYLEEKVKQEKFAFDSQALRPYFEFSRVKQGLLDVTGELFGIRYVEVKDASVWHSSVTVYDVMDGDKKLGRIYLDLFPRDNKYKHAAQFDLRTGVRDVQLPQGVLVCNFSDPSKSEHALMDHDQVVTFFHEFGHLLHHVLGGNQRFAEFSGVATEWDFVEAPSQLFEEWAWDLGVLQRFAKHYQTGEVISADLVQKMRAADEFGKGIDARQQMYYAAMSLQYHKQDTGSFDMDAMMADLQKRYSKFPFVEGTHFNLSFGHLGGYSAGYYTYMWSKVIAKDLFSPFKAHGIMNKEDAMRYRKTVLEAGGSQDAEMLVRNFLGRSYDFKAFQEWLLSA